MSVTRVQLVGNVSTGASFAGIVTATSFSGNVTGTASTASFATTSFGLAGSPNITVGTIGATSLNASGVVTATSFVGSGANLTGVISGVGINTAGGSVGTGATILDFRGAGISTVTVSAGIATINIAGGSSGGASVSISTVAPSTPANGDLWFDNSDGNTYIYYTAQSVWVVSQTYGY